MLGKFKTHSLHLDVVLFLIGLMLTFISYSSFDAAFFSALIFLIAIVLVVSFNYKARDENAIFIRSLSVGIVMASIGAYYAKFLGDEFSDLSDASWFYNLSRGSLGLMHLDDLLRLTEGAGAVFVWQRVYSVAQRLDFEIDQYVGISVNIILVALSALVSAKIVKIVYGQDPQRLLRFKRLWTFCGIFWLFQSLHLRDAWVLFSVSLLLYVWTKFIDSKSLRNFSLVVTSSAFLAYTFIFLRTEYVFLPLAFFACSVFAVLFSGESTIEKRRLATFISILGFALVTVLFMIFSEQLISKLFFGFESYGVLSETSSGENSLGMDFIINQSLPVRLVVGSLYLFLFPVPFWVGFQTESAYHLFKSLNALYFYFLTPLFIFSLIKFFTDWRYRTQELCFLLAVFSGFTFSIAVTSLEGRHFASFISILMIFSLIPDLCEANDRLLFKKILSKYLIFVGVIHTGWYGMKFL